MGRLRIPNGYGRRIKGQESPAGQQDRMGRLCASFQNIFFVHRLTLPGCCCRGPWIGRWHHSSPPSSRPRLLLPRSWLQRTALVRSTHRTTGVGALILFPGIPPPDKREDHNAARTGENQPIATPDRRRAEQPSRRTPSCAFSGYASLRTVPCRRK